MPANHCIPHTEETKNKIRASKLGKPATWKIRDRITIDGIIYYRCGCCREFFTRELFYKSNRNSIGITSECRKCHCINSVKSRDPDKVRKNSRKYMKKARIINADVFRKRDRDRYPKRKLTIKYKVRLELNNAIRRGKIKRPEKCSSCGCIGKTHGHHSDYNKPFDVEWLCSLCHGKRHRKLSR